MRLLIDLQGAQSSNALRGIGRYSVGLVSGILRNRGEDDVHLLLNTSFPQRAAELRAAFEPILPANHVHVFASAVSPTSNDDEWCRAASFAARELAISEVGADVLLVTSHFEGFHDGAVTSPTSGIRQAAVLYDLIPHLFADHYLQDAQHRAWYGAKLNELRQLDALLTISTATKADALAILQRAADSVVNISSAVDPILRPPPLSPDESAPRALGIDRPFLMYTGGIDVRKNIEGLLRSFALLPPAVRESHQLAIVCSIQDDERVRLTDIVRSLGLPSKTVVATGYVDDATLLALYQSCRAFVFPSWYEGFGLPVLEAMACGRAVIGSSSSSIIELIGRPDALFNPHDDRSIADLIERVLTDDAFRSELEHWGLERSIEFTWDRSARLALTALRALAEPTRPAARPVRTRRPRLAMLSPLPPTPSGISDYAVDLLAHLGHYYDIELVVADQSPAEVELGLPTHDTDWFRRNPDHFDRVLYHIGNSEFHRHMFALLRSIPGTVVLHDFYLSNLIRHLDLSGLEPGLWPRMLYYSHGYRAVSDLQNASTDLAAMWRYPTNLQVLQDADGVIVHSHYARQLAHQWYGVDDGESWQVVPLMRPPARVTPQQRSRARGALGFADDEFVICSFGMTGPTKLNLELVHAFAETTASQGRSRLLFIGPHIGGDYDAQLAAALGTLGDQDLYRSLGRVDADAFRMHLQATDLAVQLRANSRGESSAAVLDCMNAGLPVVVNASGAQAELPPYAVHLLPERFSKQELAQAIDSLFKSPGNRQRLGQRAAEVVMRDHNPQRCAESYHAAIERFSRRPSARSNIARRMRGISGAPSTRAARISVATALARTFPPQPRVPQLLVDVSELVVHDAGTGIQRVVRNVLKTLMTDELLNLRVEPVYADTRQGYRYAREFTSRFIGDLPWCGTDDPVDIRCGDVFLGLDLAPEVVPANQSFFRTLRAVGGRAYFVVYDLLPVLCPGSFAEGAIERHRRWLLEVVEADGVACISESVAAELCDWIRANAPHRESRLEITSFPLGSDFDADLTTVGYPSDAGASLAEIARRITFTVVGTLEPRKGHRQVLEAFDRLWGCGTEVNLVVVGRPGWMVDELVQLLERHPERGRRLHWFPAASDQYLDTVYRFSDCLIVASLAEGFGLPIVESARLGLPLIVRDIPVFRELAGTHAQYFSGESAADLQSAIEEWLERERSGSTISSAGVHTYTWIESARKLCARLSLAPSPT
jgi:glycosyltransferase involved in cell wall biosynthesis